jgi:hypothetical protein
VIEMTRRLARQLRAVLRKAVPQGAGRLPRPPLALHANPDGLRVRAHQRDVAVEYRQSGTRPADTFALPGEALDDLEGAREAVVLLEKVGEGSVQARWEDAGLPQARDYRAPDLANLPPFPESPRKQVPMEPGFLDALHEATRTAAREGVRFGVQQVLAAALPAFGWCLHRRVGHRAVRAALGCGLVCGLALYLGKRKAGGTGLALTLLTESVAAVAALGVRDEP